jgi:hypothetical protein
VKPFEAGQDELAMLGYIQKDAGKPHYKLLSRGFTEEQLANAILQHEAVRTTHEEDKRLITKANCVKAVYSFWYRVLAPLEPSFHRVLLYMLQSDEYMPAGEHDWFYCHTNHFFF